MKTEIQHTILVAIATTAISLLPIASQGQRVDAEKPPLPSGTYFSAQIIDSLKIPAMAPLPYNPYPALPVFSIGEGRFVYDDRQVDYATLRKEAAEKAAAEGSAPGGALAAEAGGGGGPPMATLHIGNLGNGQLAFGITTAPAGSLWDLYFVNNVVAQRWQWRRVYRGVQCDANGDATFSLQQPDPFQGYFVIFNAADNDSDGLGNGYEAWFKYNGLTTGTNNPDTDLDGMFDGWEVEYGLNPRSSVGNDGASGNPDGDSLDGFPLRNIREFNLYNSFSDPFGSFDPLKFFPSSDFLMGNEAG